MQLNHRHGAAAGIRGSISPMRESISCTREETAVLRGEDSLLLEETAFRWKRFHPRGRKQHSEKWKQHSRFRKQHSPFRKKHSCLWKLHSVGVDLHEVRASDSSVDRHGHCPPCWRWAACSRSSLLSPPKASGMSYRGCCFVSPWRSSDGLSFGSRSDPVRRDNCHRVMPRIGWREHSRLDIPARVYEATFAA
jgi:hypothetical protein